MSWDKYFLEICKTVSSNSNCFSRKVGAIIVKDKSIISTGYNGPPRGIPHCWARFELDDNLRNAMKRLSLNSDKPIFSCPRKVLGFKSGEGLEYCIAGHGERNALINAARLGIPVKDATMYMNCGVPCKDCLIEIINAGISEIVCFNDGFYDGESEYLLKYSNLKVRFFEDE